MSLVVTLVTLALIAIPIVFVVKIARRVQQISRRFSDPARLQRAFAESAAVDLHATAYEARIGLQRKGAYAVPTRPPGAVAPEPIQLFEEEPQPKPPPLRRPTRLRVRPTQSPIAGLDMGESFRLAEPPDQGEPPVRVAISNWFGVALFAAAAVYYFLR
jgi:hypothetical protein